MDKCHKGDHKAIEANHNVIDVLQKQLEATNHDYAKLLKERTDYLAMNTLLTEKLEEEYNRGVKAGLEQAADIIEST